MLDGSVVTSWWFHDMFRIGRKNVIFMLIISTNVCGVRSSTKRKILVAVVNLIAQKNDDPTV